MKLIEFDNQFHEAAYAAWKDPSYVMSTPLNPPDPGIYIMINGGYRQVSHIDSNSGNVIIHVSES